MPEEEIPMPKDEMTALKVAGDLDLREPDLDRASATVSAALEREYEAEREQAGARNSVGRWQRSKRFVIAVLIVLVVGGVATVGYAALTGSSTASDGIGCYPGDEIGGSVTVVGLDGRRATETCAEEWAAGAVGPGVNRAPAPLHACVSEDDGGPIRVLTSTDPSTCERVELVENPNAGFDPAARQFGEFESELMTILESEGFTCVGPERMRPLIERLLAKHDLQGWVIGESGNFDQVNRCATLALDSDAGEITMFAGRP